MDDEKTTSFFKKRKKGIIALITVIAIIVISVIGVGVYSSDYYHADVASASAILSPDGYSVRELGDNLAFVPDSPVFGLIFYPGGKVDETAYAPLMAELAKNDVLCVLVKMPMRLAVLDVNAADGIAENFPQVDRWYIGGHSLGGAMAATYCSKHTDAFDGLLLLGAYSTADISASGLDVLLVYGSNDGVLNREKYDECKVKLPDNFTEKVIEGGCHSFFADYGMQKGDGEPTITRDEQIKATVDAFIEYTEIKH